MSAKSPRNSDDELGLEGLFDSPSAAEPWFFQPAVAELDDDEVASGGGHKGLVDAAAWSAAEGALSADLATLMFDVGRLAERVQVAGQGAIQRLALAEAASLSWYSGDRVTSDQLALWLSYRIGAATERGEGLIRTAWVARRLMAGGTAQQGVALMLRDVLGEARRADAGLIADVVAELVELAGVSAITQGCALYHLWRGLDERPDHLRGPEAAVLGARAAGQVGLPFLPLSLTGFGALTANGSEAARLAGWITSAHRAVLAALMMLERLAAWQDRALAETDDLQGRTPARLIAALVGHPVLGVPQAVAETGASRAAVQRNLDVLLTRGLVREVTGQGRYRAWAVRM